MNFLITKSITDPLFPEDLPVLVEELELCNAIKDFSAGPSLSGEAYKHVRFLVRLAGLPVGYVMLIGNTFDAATLAGAIWSQLSSEINDVLHELNAEPITGLGVVGLKVPVTAPVDFPFISVVICTRDRPEGAMRTLRSVMAVDYPLFEVVLVDNAPKDDKTFSAVMNEYRHDMRVRYVREMRPGLSVARNRGIAEATSALVAFTDDDVHVDSLWLRGIASGFARGENIGCVTGIVPSAELETVSQLYFDQRYTWGARPVRRLFDSTANRGESALYPYTAGVFGTGANFALNLDVLGKIARFDESLGAGTPTGGGEDLDMFVRVILGGHQLAYEPSAIITHVHRSGMADLHHQLFNYGTGLTAYLAKQMSNPRQAVDLMRRIPQGLLHMRRTGRKAKRAQLIPSSVSRRELSGMMLGPFRYARGHFGASQPEPTNIISLDSISVQTDVMETGVMETVKL